MNFITNLQNHINKKDYEKIHKLKYKKSDSNYIFIESLNDNRPVIKNEKYINEFPKNLVLNARISYKLQTFCKNIELNQDPLTSVHSQQSSHYTGLQDTQNIKQHTTQDRIKHNIYTHEQSPNQNTQTYLNSKQQSDIFNDAISQTKTSINTLISESALQIYNSAYCYKINNIERRNIENTAYENKNIDLISDHFGYFIIENKSHIFFDNKYGNFEILNKDIIFTKNFIYQNKNLNINYHNKSQILFGYLGGTCSENMHPKNIEQAFFQIYKYNNKFVYNIFTTSQYKKAKIDPFIHDNFIFIGNKINNEFHDMLSDMRAPEIPHLNKKDPKDNETQYKTSTNQDKPQIINDEYKITAINDNIKVANENYAFEKNNLIQCTSLNDDICNGMIKIAIKNSTNNEIYEYISVKTDHVENTNIIKILFQKHKKLEKND